MDRCTFMMDRCTFMMERCTFMDSWDIHCHYKARKSKDFFNITLIVFIRKKNVIHTWDDLTASKSWANFHFWVKCPVY